MTDAKDTASAQGTSTVVDSCLGIELERNSGRGKTNGDAEGDEMIWIVDIYPSAPQLFFSLTCSGIR